MQKQPEWKITIDRDTICDYLQRPEVIEKARKKLHDNGGNSEDQRDRQIALLDVAAEHFKLSSAEIMGFFPQVEHAIKRMVTDERNVLPFKRKEY